MEFGVRFGDLLERVSAYSPAEVVTELVLIWIVIFAILRFVRGTRAAGALKGLLILLVLVAILSRLIGGSDAFQRLGYLYDRFLALVAIALVVIFQPELRRALVRLGETRLFRQTPSEISEVVETIADAARYLGRAKFGGLMVIERDVGLEGLVEGGVKLDSELSAPLLKTIFFPGSALHDLAVVIKGKRVHAAAVQLPLAEAAEMPDPALGSRHRAAVGLTKECDALVVVVSEETGALRIAERGRLFGPFAPPELIVELKARLGRARKPAEAGPSRDGEGSAFDDTGEVSEQRRAAG